MNKIFNQKSLRKIILILLTISWINSVDPNQISFTRKTKKKIEVNRQSPNNIIYKKNYIKINLINDDPAKSNYYSSGIYNFIEFDIPKDTEAQFHFNGDCIIPIVISTNPVEFSNSYNFIDDVVNLFFNDIGVSDFRNLEINEKKTLQINSSIKNFFINQEIESFSDLHRGVIYCFEFENQGLKSLSFNVTWEEKKAAVEEEDKTNGSDESLNEDKNVESNTPLDKPKETINGNEIDLDFDNGSSEVYYENIFEIKSEKKIFNLFNLKKFSSIDVQDLKDNDLVIELSYEESNKSITQTETKKRLELSFQEVDNMIIIVKLADTSTSSFLSFKVTSEEDNSSSFFSTTNIIIIAVVCSLIFIIIVVIIIVCLIKKKKKNEIQKENKPEQNTNQDTKLINKQNDDELIPVYQIDLKNKFHNPEEEKGEKYPIMQDSINSIDKNNNNLNYPDKLHESIIKKETAKK